MNVKNLVSHFLRLSLILILFQTLFFKFTGAPESVYIFSQLGIEPLGRYATGIIEIFAIVLLLVPKTYGFGSLVALGTMAGATLSHIFVLGIEVQEDGGLLFFLALYCLFSAILLLYIYRELPLRFLSRFIKV